VIRELARKLLHVAMGGFALLIPYLSWWQISLLAALAVVHNLLLLPRYGGRRLFRGEAARRGVDPGIAIYPASVLVLSLVFAGHPAVIAAAWGLLAAGDGMATICGMLLGRFAGALPWNRSKSWPGLLGFALFGSAAATGLWWWTTGSLPTEIAIKLTIVAAITAVLETLPLGLDDNLVVPLGGGALIYAALLIEPARLSAGESLWMARLPWALGVNLLLALLAYRARSVDVGGALHGTLLGTALWVFAGWRGFLMLLAFFVLATAATKVGYQIKLREGTAQAKGGRRGAPNAWANAGAGALLALLAAGTPHFGLFALAIVAAFATACSDTLGSEIGQAYGRRTFLITTLRPVPRGTDGAVSLEGTLAGIAGSIVIGLLAWGIGSITPLGLVWVVLAAFLGTTVESYIGAVFERAQQINNEAQNLLNTLVGGLVALALAAQFGGAL
jgi:uncharacterized protein (TIGR00297 family)